MREASGDRVASIDLDLMEKELNEIIERDGANEKIYCTKNMQQVIDELEEEA